MFYILLLKKGKKKYIRYRLLFKGNMEVNFMNDYVLKELKSDFCYIIRVGDFYNRFLVGGFIKEEVINGFSKLIVFFIRKLGK